jgi:hypothetical protein
MESGYNIPYFKDDKPKNAYFKPYLTFVCHCGRIKLVNIAEKHDKNK